MKKFINNKYSKIKNNPEIYNLMKKTRKDKKSNKSRRKKYWNQLKEKKSELRN